MVLAAPAWHTKSSAPDRQGAGEVVEALASAFCGTRLADRYEVSEEEGGVLRIAQETGVAAAALPDAAAARAALLAPLQLVFGVGPATVTRLKAAGCRSIEDLRCHRRFATEAESVLADWRGDGHAGDSSGAVARAGVGEAGLGEKGSEPDLLGLCQRLTRRMGGAGHVLSSLACGLVEPGEIAFLDTETLGLSGQAIFLCGIGRFEAGRLMVEQFLAPDVASEQAMLGLALERLGQARVLVTYNGLTADVAWLRQRCFYYRMGRPAELPHVDLVYGTRHCFVREDGVLDNARLPTVQERLLGMARPEVDLPSWAIPGVYDAYARSGGELEGMLVPVVEHNRSDLEALVSLLEKLAWRAVETVA